MNKLFLALASIAAVAPLALRADVTYSLNPTTIGAGSATGTITTDGTVGNLGNGNFLDWNIEINNGSSSFDLNSGNSQLDDVGGVLATPSDLLFNFTAVGFAGLLIQNPGIGSGENWFALDDNGGVSGHSSSENLTVGVDNGSNSQVLDRSGLLSFATTGVPDSTSAAALLGVSVLALLGVAKKLSAQAS